MDIHEFHTWLINSKTVTMDDVAIGVHHKEPREDMFFVNEFNNEHAYAMIDDSSTFDLVNDTVIVTDCDGDKFNFKRLS